MEGWRKLAGKTSSEVILVMLVYTHTFQMSRYNCSFCALVDYIRIVWTMMKTTLPERTDVTKICKTVKAPKQFEVWMINLECQSLYVHIFLFN